MKNWHKMTLKRTALLAMGVVLIWAAGAVPELQAAANPVASGGLHIRESATAPFVPVEVVLLTESELVKNAAEWISAFSERSTGTALPISGRERLGKAARQIVAVVGEGVPYSEFRPVPSVGSQGFVLERLDNAKTGPTFVCWSPTALGCRYGLIEILRCLRVAGQSVSLEVGRVVERPQFERRICYVNPAEHLQNAFNPNLLFDTALSRWSDADWERFIDMVSAYRYTEFEYWLPPTLFSNEALQGSKRAVAFTATMNRVTEYAQRRGVAVHPIFTVNTVGEAWHFHCPKDAKEKTELLSYWDHWSRVLKGVQVMGIFPGDPGGCTRNGCTAETFVDLCLELSRVIRTNNPGAEVEVGTWGEPFGGWGVPLWTGDTNRAARSMTYLLRKLPDFPSNTSVSINIGFSPDCNPAQNGGDGRPYAKAAARTNPVLTWDYSVTEGEGTVYPHCRVRRMLERRREEVAVGCYSGGICYTMSPQLNCLSIFCSAEAYWNPERSAEAILSDYGRLVFGEERAAIGPMLEEFEVVPDWGYYAPFPFTPARLHQNMQRLRALLESVPPNIPPRLPVAATMANYRQSLLFYAELFGKLADISIAVNELTSLTKAAGKAPADSKELVSLEEAEQLLTEPVEFPQKSRLRDCVARLRQLDAGKLTKAYWDTVYGIYGAIPHPTDPRAQGATTALFRLFHCELAMVRPPSVLRSALESRGKPFNVIDLGRPAGERGWTLDGWTEPSDTDGVSWRASFDRPGLLTSTNFQNRGYRWLVLRLTEGPKGDRKTISLNDQVIGEFVRTGPPRNVKTEWWVTRSFPIPDGLLRDGRVQLRFTDPGIAISGVAFSTEPMQAD